MIEKESAMQKRLRAKSIKRRTILRRRSTEKEIDLIKKRLARIEKKLLKTTHPNVFYGTLV